MTVKKGDIVFVSQPHHSTPVPGVVLSVVPAPAEVWPDINVHIISSADPYASTRVSHKCYVGDSGYLAADEDEPTEPKPKETKNADASQEYSSGESSTSNAEGNGAGVDDGESEAPANEESDSETESEEDSSEDQGPFDVEPDEEDDDEREEDETAPPVSEGAEDGKSVSSTRRKRGGRKGR